MRFDFKNNLYIYYIMNRNIIFPAVLIALLVLFFSACKNSEKNEDSTYETEIDQPVFTDREQISAQNVFNSIPARAEIIKLISEDKIEYDPDYLNKPDVASKYALENSRALNLGVYGADLSVTGAFDQTQESMLFLTCVNILAKNLGVSTAFDQRMMDRMEANKENRDSTLEIIAQSFRKADEYLKENDRPGTSALILCGAWIEGMYVSCMVAKRINSTNTIKTILQQQESLKHLIIMTEASHLNADTQYVVEGLKTIQENIKTATAKNELSLDNIKEVSANISKLRKKVVETF